MFTHDLHLSHTRHPIAPWSSKYDASSSISISTDSNDLVEACTELLTRMPPDVYEAFKKAMIHTLRIGEGGAGGSG